MNVLIFTGSFGMGHIAAAHALEEEILCRNPQASVRVVDVIKDLCPQLERLVYGCFDLTVQRYSGVYNLLNRMAGYCSCAPFKRIMIHKMGKLIEESGANLLLSTLPLSSQYISAYRQATGDPTPLYTYITDISAHNEWITPATDCYFVGDNVTRRQLLRQGIPPRRIVVSGIPVHRAFRPSPRTPKKQRELLIMGGGLGLIPQASTLLKPLAEAPDVHVTVITGTNEGLRQELSAAYPSFHVLGYTDQVAGYMSRADLLLTKAGGITTFEAIRSETPLCLFRPFLIQEMENAAYVHCRGFGKVLPQLETDAQFLLNLLGDRQALEEMRHHMRAAQQGLEPVTALDRYNGEAAEAC